MPKRKPPESLNDLRALLDQAAVARTLLPLSVPAYQPQQLAEALHVSIASIAILLLVDVARDRVAAIVPADARVDLVKLASALGARSARLFGGADRHQADPAPLAAPVTTLPTIMERSLLSHDYLYTGTGDAQWALRIRPAALHKATSAIIADMVRGLYQPSP